MRLATAADEILPLKDPRVQSNPSYLLVILLSRVIVRLGGVEDVNPKTIEGLFAADLSYLQDLYNGINANGHRTLDAVCPRCEHEFQVALEGVLVASFSECAGLNAETEVEELVEGGENRYHHKLPKGTKYGNLTLKHGMTDSRVLWDWHRDVVMGSFKRKRVAVILWNVWDPDITDERWRWTLKDAYPVKWTGPEFKSDGNTLAIEAVELVHNGIADVA